MQGGTTEPPLSPFRGEINKATRIKLQVDEIVIDLSKPLEHILRKVKEVEKKFEDRDIHVINFVHAVVGECAKYKFYKIRSSSGYGRR
ncbi:MAG TPA: hypothetical protein ENF41_00630 [Candidatus Bathyarchaeota archaeon]|nr:hypothetical protein [Candidatus Bathyarchaeota archaeon]